MAYEVRLTARAERDLADILVHIDFENSNTARRWYQRLRAAILSLGNIPERFPFASQDSVERHMLFGRKPHVYRVIFCIFKRERIVEVIHIRHGARRRISSPGH